MSLLSLLLALIGCGVVLWLIEQAPYISGQLKSIIRWVVIALLIIWIGSAVGVFDWLRSARVG